MSEFSLLSCWMSRASCEEVEERTDGRKNVSKSLRVPLSLSLLGLELGSLTPFIRPIFPLRPSTSVSRSKDGSIVSWMSPPPPPPPPPPLPKRFCLSRNPSLLKTKHNQRKRKRERYNPYPGRSRSGQVKAKSGPPKRVERSRVFSWGSALLQLEPLCRRKMHRHPTVPLHSHLQERQQLR